MKIKKGTALAFSHHPVGQLTDRDIRGTVLEFVTLFCFHDLPPRRDQLVGKLLVVLALRRIQSFDVAVEFVLHRQHLFLLFLGLRFLR